MSDQPRVVKVLGALLVSMTVGAIVLMALGSNPPKDGPFCLSSYYHLDPVEEAVTVSVGHRLWSSVEVYYSGTRAGNVEQLVSLSGLAAPEDINCHFVVCNGLGGGNGQVQATEKWRRQWAVVPSVSFEGPGRTIRVCVIADQMGAGPTDYQISRTDALVESLAKTFDVATGRICYPADWGF
jgi:hypothetical protein